MLTAEGLYRQLFKQYGCAASNQAATQLHQSPQHQTQNHPCMQQQQWALNKRPAACSPIKHDQYMARTSYCQTRAAALCARLHPQQQQAKCSTGTASRLPNRPAWQYSRASGITCSVLGGSHPHYQGGCHPDHRCTPHPRVC